MWTGVTLRHSGRGFGGWIAKNPRFVKYMHSAPCRRSGHRPLHLGICPRMRREDPESARGQRGRRKRFQYPRTSQAPEDPRSSSRALWPRRSPSDWSVVARGGGGRLSHETIFIVVAFSRAAYLWPDPGGRREVRCLPGMRGITPGPDGGHLPLPSSQSPHWRQSKRKSPSATALIKPIRA